MGLSRNKVAVSEGAAGSPPFYGESTAYQGKRVKSKWNKPIMTREWYGRFLLFNFQGLFPDNGGVAQLGEHLPCKQGVMGSNPIISTSG